MGRLQDAFTASHGSGRVADRASAAGEVPQDQDGWPGQRTLAPAAHRPSRLFAALVAAAGLLVLGGWLTGIDVVKSGIPGALTMKANTALAFVLAGAALWLLVPNHAGKRQRVAGISLAGLVAAIAALTLAEWVFDTDLRIDQLLFHEPAGEPGTAVPGRMAAVTALCFLFSSASLLTLRLREVRVSQALMAPAFAILLASVAAIVNDVNLLRGVPVATPMAGTTAAVFASLCAGLALARDGGFMRVARSATAAGLMIRWLLPLTVAVPLFLGWLVLTGHRHGLYGSAVGFAMFGAFDAVVVVVSVAAVSYLAYQREVAAKRAEVSLLALAAIVESSEDAIAGCDPEGKVTSWNAAAERLFGYSHAEVIHQSAAFLFEGAPQGEPEAIMMALEAGRPFKNLSTVRVSASGAQTPVSVSIFPVRGPGGAVVGKATIFRDVSERRRLERLNAAHLRLLEFATDHVGADVSRYGLDELRTLLDSPVAALHSVGADAGTLILEAVSGSGMLATAAAVSTGADPAWAEALRTAAVVAHADCGAAAPCARLLPDGAQPGNLLSLGVRFGDATHVIVTVGGKTGGYDRADAEAMELFAGMYLDIVGRKLADAVGQQREHELTEMVGTVDAVVWLYDLVRQQWLFVSPFYEQTFGSPVEELETDRLSWLKHVHPHDRGRVDEVLEAAGWGARDLDYRIVRATDGDVRWLHDRTFVVTGADGRPSRLIGVIEDVTGRKHLESEFLQAQKMEAVGQLAAGIAHDFNNLLTAVLGYAGFAQAGLPMDSDARGDLDHVIDAACRARDLTANLLTFARKHPVNPALVDLVGVVRGIEPLIRPLVGSAIDVGIETPADAVPVVIDPRNLEQVIMNLAANARDAMPGGGVLQISVGRGDTPSQAVLRVTDTGMGMTEEVKQRVFEPFFTTKDVGRGTGLGLATCFGIIRQARGEISVDSEAGQGTTFSIRLPLAETPATPAAHPRAESATPQPAAVLVVEDEPNLRLLMSRALEAFGYRVCAIEDAAMALARLNRPDDDTALVVTDVSMPRANAAELQDWLSHHRPDLPVLFVTGFEDRGLESARLGDVPSDVLQKPFLAAELASAARKLIDANASGDKPQQQRRLGVVA